MRYLGTVFVLTAAVGFAGCGQFGGSSTSSSHGGMAVVDLDKVAAETGRNRELAQQIQVAGNTLNQQLAKTVENAKGQFEEKRKSYGEEPTEEQQKELAQWTNTANSQLTQIQNQARQKYEQFKQEQIAQFRSEIKPIAQEIAAKRGLSVVIPKNEGLLLSIDPGVDITEDVIKVMREKHPTKVETVSNTPPAPAVQSETPTQAADADVPTKKTTKRTQSAKPAGSNRSAKADDEKDFR
jgi:Skp family chaperone for outer membrane proteins